MHSGFQQDSWDKAVHTSYYSALHALKRHIKMPDLHPGYVKTAVKKLSESKKEAQKMFRRLRSKHEKSHRDNSEK